MEICSKRRLIPCVSGKRGRAEVGGGAEDGPLINRRRRLPCPRLVNCASASATSVSPAPASLMPVYCSPANSQAPGCGQTCRQSERSTGTLPSLASPHRLQRYPSACQSSPRGPCRRHSIPIGTRPQTRMVHGATDAASVFQTEAAPFDANLVARRAPGCRHVATSQRIDDLCCPCMAVIPVGDSSIENELRNYFIYQSGHFLAFPHVGKHNFPSRKLI